MKYGKILGSIFVTFMIASSCLPTNAATKILEEKEPFMTSKPNYGWVTFTIDSRYTEEYTLGTGSQAMIATFTHRRLGVTIDASRTDLGGFYPAISDIRHENPTRSFVMTGYSVIFNPCWAWKFVENSDDVTYNRNTAVYGEFSAHALGGNWPAGDTYTMNLNTN